MYSEEYKFDILYFRIRRFLFCDTVTLRHIPSLLLNTLSVTLFSHSHLLLILYHLEVWSMNMFVLSGFSALFDEDRVGKLSAAGACAGLVTWGLVHIVEVLQGVRDHAGDVDFLNGARSDKVHGVIDHHLIHFFNPLHLLGSVTVTHLDWVGVLILNVILWWVLPSIYLFGCVWESPVMNLWIVRLLHLWIMKIRRWRWGWVRHHPRIVIVGVKSRVDRRVGWRRRVEIRLVQLWGDLTTSNIMVTRQHIIRSIDSLLCIVYLIWRLLLMLILWHFL